MSDPAGERLARLEQAFTDLPGRLDRIQIGLDRMESRLDARLDRIEAAQRSDFHWLIGTMLAIPLAAAGAFAGLVGVLLRLRRGCP
jgi:hypothetical protein